MQRALRPSTEHRARASSSAPRRSMLPPCLRPRRCPERGAAPRRLRPAREGSLRAACADRWQAPGAARLRPAHAGGHGGGERSRPDLRAQARRSSRSTGSADLSYFNPHGRFRVAAFSQRGSPSFVFRAVPVAPRHGGAGAARGRDFLGRRPARPDRHHRPHRAPARAPPARRIIDLINSRRPLHILTIEDPIEYLHRDAAAIVCQREIGLDAPDLPHGPARGPAPGPRRDPDRRGARRGDGHDRAARGGDRPPGDLHAPHPQRRRDRAALHRPLRRPPDLARAPDAGGARWWASPPSAWCRAATAAGAELRGAGELRPDPRPDRSRQAPRASSSLAIREGDYYGMRSFDQCLLSKVRDG